jgi:hypothetical protein
MSAFDENYFIYGKDKNANKKTLLYSIATVNPEFYYCTVLNALKAGVQYFLFAAPWTTEFNERSELFRVNVLIQVIAGPQLTGKKAKGLNVCFFQILNLEFRKYLIM